MTREEQKERREKLQAEAEEKRKEVADERHSKLAFIRMLKMCKAKDALISYSGVEINFNE